MTQDRFYSNIVGIPPEEADTIIRPHNYSVKLLLVDLVRHRRIFRNLLVRDIRRQYIDLKLGFVWVFSQPVIMTLIFTLLHRGSGAKVVTEIPYPLYLLSGFLFWFTWADAWRTTASADRTNAALISKVFFPRLYSPLAAACSRVLAFGICLIPISLLMAGLGIYPTWTVVFLPFIVLQALILAFSLGLIFALLAMKSRDWDRVQGQVLYLGLFVSPVIYSVQTIAAPLRAVYSVNPMVGLLDAFRASVTGLGSFPWGNWGYSCAVTLVLFLCAVYAFRKTEARMLDEL